MSKWQSKEQLIQLLSSLVEIPSITGTEAEVILPDFVVEQLSDLQYFKRKSAPFAKIRQGTEDILLQH